ncbi:alpha-hydroxy-acid oxidizing protein [Rhizobium sp. RAF36]
MAHRVLGCVGVAKAAGILKTELHRNMALLGVTSIGGIGDEHIVA